MSLFRGAFVHEDFITDEYNATISTATDYHDVHLYIKMYFSGTRIYLFFVPGIQNK